MDKTPLLDSLKRNGFPRKVVEAFEKVAREDFVPEYLAAYAYEDMALPIESGSTISQPYTIAFMLSLLDAQLGQKVLEIGSGSGYVLALLSEIIGEGKVYGLEINKNLAVKSKKLLLGDAKICIFNKSGFEGLWEFASFDRILVSASCKNIATAKGLLPQLKDPGVLVAPVQSSIIQIKKNQGKIEEKEFEGFAFVPLRE